MYCPQCGSELPEDAVFCNQCGAKIPTHEAAKVTGVQTRLSTTPKPPQSDKAVVTGVAESPAEQSSAPSFAAILRGALPVLSLVAGLIIGPSFLGGTLYYLGALSIMGGLAKSIPGGGCAKWLALGIVFSLLSVLTGSVFKAR